MPESDQYLHIAIYFQANAILAYPDVVRVLPVRQF